MREAEEQSAPGAKVKGQKAKAKSQNAKVGGSCCGSSSLSSEAQAGTCAGKRGVNPGVTSAFNTA